jgi:RNA polymerase sigma-70 factor (ECF subfamily)
MDEAEAIAQLREGDIAALRALVELYQVQAVQAAVLITRDRALAEDIVQNAFVRSYERIHQFDASRPFRPWFLRMVVNDALKAVAGQRRHVPFDSHDDAAYPQVVAWLEATAREPEDDLQRSELREAIGEALAALSPRQRAAVVLRYYLGLDERETAREMGCAPGTVKWHLHVARERLRSLLSPFAP